jgi:glycosyltransferase involved in cell wall biosynthesis
MISDNVYTPIVTVYIANYNYANYVKQSIESVLEQIYRKFELIIIDDGSTDGSRSVIQEYIEHPKVRVIFQENKGLIATNNIALHAAKGKYIMRLDADDYLDENALLVMIEAIDKSDNLALVFPDYYYVDAQGRVTSQERRHNFNKDVSLFDQPAHGACTLIRRDCLLEVGGYSKEFNCQDGWDLWLKLIENYDIKNINLPLFYYRKHGSNLTNDTDRLLITRSKIYAKHINRINRRPLKVVAVIPVRGVEIEKYSQALSIVSGMTLIDWTVNAALNSKLISEVVVTTPSKNVISHLENTFGNRVKSILRNTDDSLENVSYASAIKDSMKFFTTKFDAILELTTEYPFRSTEYIDKAINVMRVHNVDRVISVIPEDSVFYKHTGSGLKVVGNNYLDNSLRLEREYIYRQCGGLILVKRSFYNDKKYKSSEIKGHIILSKRASIRVQNSFEAKVAELSFKFKP